jgi:hypothetical protein
MPLAVIYRGTLLLLWGLAIWNSFVCRGLFWDGASFLANVLETGKFYDSYTARAHIAWLTQLPILFAIKLGVSDTRLLAMIQSAALFALPIANYQLALARVRDDATALAIVLAVITIVYLPTSFFIVGEYNTVYAAATATVSVAITCKGRRDAALLCLLAALCLRSYEVMIYLGPLLAACVLWATARSEDDIMRLLGFIAAFCFVGGAVVAGITMAYYWDNPHFILVRAAAFDFWQNLQFIVPLAGLAIFAILCLVWPSGLRGPAPMIVIGLTAAVLVATAGARRLDPQAMLFPPAHYVARTAAGWVLCALLGALWVRRAWQGRGRPVFIDLLLRHEIGRRIATAMAILMLAAAIPDMVLTRIWIDYLAFFRGVVVGHAGFVDARGLPMQTWPYRLFSQDWSYPALSAVVRRSAGDAVVLSDLGYRGNGPFDPACGTLPRLPGYAWRD